MTNIKPTTAIISLNTNMTPTNAPTRHQQSLNSLLVGCWWHDTSLKILTTDNILIINSFCDGVC